MILASCGFHFSKGNIADHYKTVAIPYADGDFHGILTNHLAKEISRTGGLLYKDEGAELTLHIHIVDVYQKDIGYRFDRDPDEDYNERLLPFEGRLIAYAEITLEESRTGKEVLGPAVVRATADYDHDYYTSADRAFRFSLGQVDDIDVAEEQALEPLHRALAKRIVEFIQDSW